MRTSISSLSLLALLSTAAYAQTPNQYPIHLVDAQGVELSQINDEMVYLAFDNTTPSGIYYVHVTDGDITAVMSANDPMDRFVRVTNPGGLGPIALDLPFTQNPNPAVFGLGLNGAGQSVLLAPLDNPTVTPCHFKVWFGDTWDLSFGPTWPYIVRTPPTAIVSFRHFQIGDGTGTDVVGNVYLDTDRDGVHDAGEPALANWEVRLVSGQMVIATTTTDLAGHYVFPGVALDDYTVELTLQSGYVGTTTLQASIQVLGCTDITIADFLVAPAVLACNGHTIGFWRNRNGLALINANNILPTLPGLYLRDGAGAHVAPATEQQWKNYLQGANSINMAYMLSAQLAAMHCNVLSGRVDGACLVLDANLGNISIANLMQAAIMSLMAHGDTYVGSPWRAEQEQLKNALDDANNNRNWL